MVSKKLATLAALSMVFASSAAIAQSAQPLSLANAPAAGPVGADLSEESDMNGRRGAGIYIIGAIVLGLIIWGIIELTGDNSDSP